MNWYKIKRIEVSKSKEVKAREAYTWGRRDESMIVEYEKAHGIPARRSPFN